MKVLGQDVQDRMVVIQVGNGTATGQSKQDVVPCPELGWVSRVPAAPGRNEEDEG